MCMCMYMHMSVYIHVERHNNIRNGIMWVQTSHSTRTCTVTLCVIEPRTQPQIRIVQKNPQQRNSNSNMLVNSKPPEIVRNNFRPNSILEVIVFRIPFHFALPGCERIISHFPHTEHREDVGFCVGDSISSAAR